MRNFCLRRHLKKKRLSLTAKLLAAGLACSLGPAHGEIKLSKDWSSDQNPDGTRKPRDQNDGERFEEASNAAAYKRNPVISEDGKRGFYQLDFGTKLLVNEVKYFVRPANFMSKSKADEVCAMKDFVNTPTYQCKEGQRLTFDCHLMFFDDKFAEAGFNTVKINESYPFFCNSVPGIGVRSKGSDDLMITVQYFPIDQKPAGKIKEVGASWQRMTVLFHIKAVDGKIVAEQDDTCLGNPNRIDNIPDARVRLAKCSAANASRH